MTREDAVAELIKVSKVLGTSHVTPSAFQENSPISVSEVVEAFGSWHEALASAGLSQAWSDEGILEELRRVAETVPDSRLQKLHLRRERTINPSTAERRFGTWGKALMAARLAPNAARAWSDDEYLREIVRLTQVLGRRPSKTDMKRHGRCSITPLCSRWGTLLSACRAAYDKYGFPQRGHAAVEGCDTESGDISDVAGQVTVPHTHAPASGSRRQKVQFGEPIDFRGLRFAPTNEQGVVYLFGMVSRELGFLIESVRTTYPDCEGKRCIDNDGRRWEHVLVEFEYQSSNFQAHGHDVEGCDLIVCWVHDWQDCPLEVLELSSEIKRLPNR